MYEDINYFNYNIEDGPFGIRLSGVSYCDGSYHIKRTKSPYSVIEYVEQGRGKVILEGKEFVAEKGDVYILPAGSCHEYYSSSHDPWVKKFFNVKGPLFLDLIRDYSLDNIVVIKNCDVKKTFDEIYEYTCLKNEHEFGFYDQIAIKMHALLIEIKNIVSSNGHNEELLVVKRFIDKNLERIISNDELAGMIFRSNDHLIKAFKHRFGKTPYEYQIDRKITAAKRLLQYTQLSVGEISQRLGYSDQHYFSNLFKKKCGMSPLQYRKTKI